MRNSNPDIQTDNCQTPAGMMQNLSRDTPSSVHTANANTVRSARSSQKQYVLILIFKNCKEYLCYTKKKMHVLSNILTLLRKTARSISEREGGAASASERERDALQHASESSRRERESESDGSQHAPPPAHGSEPRYKKVARIAGTAACIVVKNSRSSG
jgi:hypothetical protein